MMKPSLHIALLFVACVLVWVGIVSAYVHFHPYPTQEREPVFTVLLFGMPAIFTIAVGVIGFKKAKSQRRGIRALIGAIWAVVFAAACGAALLVIILPVYFWAGGGE